MSLEINLTGDGRAAEEDTNVPHPLSLSGGSLALRHLSGSGELPWQPGRSVSGASGTLFRPPEMLTGRIWLNKTEVRLSQLCLLINIILVCVLE